jgi:acyl transferase domain-containing protein/NADP-dependent 3-hydroxy acid dehydrogenase YdfG
VSRESPATLDAVAVIGLAGRFPGARSVGEFWRHLTNGVESISVFTDDELRAEGVPESCLPDARYVRANGVLDDIELFDAEFFDFTPREAEITDPQHRVLLECAWECLEDAGYDPDRFDGRIGVYAGAGISTYLLRNVMRHGELPRGVGDLQILMGNNKDYVPTRISYKLNLKGPSINVNTACSTSLVAIHLACQALLDCHCDMALAGGVGIQVPQHQGYWYEEGGIGSPDGHCRAFDARAAGTVSGNGAGLVVLKRLADALEARDSIRAIVRGSAVNNDGRSKAGFTAPSVDGQAEVIAEALTLAGVEPDSIGYIETHGTGTALGDPIELAALMQAFGPARGRQQFCAIGSVKTNIGHLDEAAGVAGFIKTVLMLEHRRIPASLHFERPNPNIDFAASPFFVNTRLREWTASPRRAGVSSFGIGGTNAHVVLEEAPPRPVSTTTRRWHVLPLSSRGQASLEAATLKLAERFQQHLHADAHLMNHEGEAWLADAAYTLGVGRRTFPHRRVVVSDRLQSACNALATGDPGAMFSGVSDGHPTPVVFLFPGQGAQHIGMATELYRRERTFREVLDECAEIVRRGFGYDFRDWVYPRHKTDDIAAALTRTAHAQPVLFSIEYALARLLIGWGVRPHAMLGHSLGEYVAACVAGVFSLQDALHLVAARGALMQELAGGAMLAVPLTEAELRDLLPEGLSIAACNGPRLTTVSGPAQAVQVLQQRLGARGIGYHPLATSHAFHSAMMDPILPSLLDLVKSVRLQSPTVSYFSNVTGALITAIQATDPMYWVAHSRQPVRFGSALENVFGGTPSVFLEVGPGRNLASAALRHPARPARQPVYSTLPHPQDPEPDDKMVLSTIGRLWTEGVPVDWSAFHADERRYRVALPTQSFSRQRYWLEGQRPALTTETNHRPHSTLPVVDKRADIGSWFYVPSWHRSVLPPVPAEAQQTTRAKRWLIFVDDAGIGRSLAARLEQAGEETVTVSMGAHFTQLERGAFVLDPRSRENYRSLLAALTSGVESPDRIVHLWSLTPGGRSSLPHAHDRGLYSLVFLTQALRSCSPDKDVQLDVISSGVHDVTGAEDLDPSAATILGPVRVIPQECGNITCRSIDVALEADGSSAGDLIDRLHHELTTTTNDNVIALRGPHRWTETFAPMRVADISAATSRLKEGGVYLITGGVGGIGSILSDYLARQFKARLALVTRSGLPPATAVSAPDRQASVAADGRIGVASNKASVLLSDRADAIARSAEHIAREMGARRIDDDAGFAEAANRLCTSYTYDYFKNATPSAALRIGRVYSAEDLKHALRIQPRFAKFFDFFVRVLSEDSVIRSAGDGRIEFVRDGSEIPDPESQRKMLIGRFPEFAGIVSLLDHCVRHYPRALSGEIASIDVLYPAGSSALLEEAGRATAFRGYRDVYVEVVRRLVDDACSESRSGRVRILEVGIGDGILTRAIAPNLHSRSVEYWATDISRTFVVRAEKEAAAAGFDFMKFAVFDISRDPVPPELEDGGFDFVLGLDVVHATPRIQDTLIRLHSLLAPGGVLGLIETVETHRWTDMIWGLAEGWWSFDDDDLRHHSPLLGLSAWETVVRQSGFDDIQVHPRDPEDRQKADCGLILGQKAIEPAAHGVCEDDPITMRRIRHVRQLRALGSEVIVVTADVGDEDQMRAAVDTVRRRFGSIDGVIHAAGVTAPGVVFNLVDETTRANAETLFRARIEGPQVLARVLGHEILDFCLLISSNAAILGGLGFSAYAAASAFMDAFATAQARRTGQRWISANWDGWPTEEVSAATVPFQTSIDRFAMTRAECEQAFERALVQSSPHVVVSAGDLMARLRVWNRRGAPGADEERARSARHPGRWPDQEAIGESRTPPAAGSSSLHLRPPLSTDAIAPVTPTERTLCRIWDELFAIEGIGIDDNFFELRGDSLLATQLIAIASKEFRVPVPIRSIFERPSVSQLARLIDDLIEASSVLSTVPADHAQDAEEEGSI